MQAWTTTGTAVDEAEARRVLAVSAGATAEEVRRAFRRGLHRSHPDVAPDDPGAGRDTARLVQAYAVLRRARPAAPGDRPPRAGRAGAAPEPAPAPAAEAGRIIVHGDSLTYPAPPDEVYRRLVQAADQLGELTYVDPDARLLDTVVLTPEGTACSLLASLQGRAHGTEVFLTLEPLGRDPCPPVGPLVVELAARLAASPP